VPAAGGESSTRSTALRRDGRGAGFIAVLAAVESGSARTVVTSMVALRASALARIFMDFSLKAFLDIFAFAGFLAAVFLGADFFAAVVLAAGLFAREDTRVAAPGFVAGLAARVIGIISKTQILVIPQRAIARLRTRAFAWNRNPATISGFTGSHEDARPGTTSSAEEHEPDDAEDQYRKPGRHAQQREHRRAGFGLARLGRSFDDLAVLFSCHGALDSRVK
jgi:hypothetical protein